MKLVVYTAVALLFVACASPGSPPFDQFEIPEGYRLHKKLDDNTFRQHVRRENPEVIGVVFQRAPWSPEWVSEVMIAEVFQPALEARLARLGLAVQSGAKYELVVLVRKSSTTILDPIAGQVSFLTVLAAGMYLIDNDQEHLGVLGTTTSFDEVQYSGGADAWRDLVAGAADKLAESITASLAIWFGRLR